MGFKSILHGGGGGRCPPCGGTLEPIHNAQQGGRLLKCPCQFGQQQGWRPPWQLKINCHPAEDTGHKKSTELHVLVNDASPMNVPKKRPSQLSSVQFLSLVHTSSIVQPSYDGAATHVMPPQPHPSHPHPRCRLAAFVHASLPRPRRPPVIKCPFTSA